MNTEMIETTQRRIKSFVDKILRRIGILAIVLFVICTGIGVLKHKAEKEMGIAAQEIWDALEPIGEFATYEYAYTGEEKIEDSIQLKNFKVPFTKHVMSIPYNGIIKVGYHVSDMNVQVTGREIQITLPEPQILDNYLEIDYDEIMYSNNILNPINPGEIGDWEAEEKEQRLKNAVEMGLYRSAETNAKEIIRDVLGRIDGYHVSFR